MNPRRYSQVERALQILDKSRSVDILKDDQYLLFVFKKAERIVAALYIITGLFPDLEPMKWALRESGTELLKQTLSFKERALVQSREFLSDTAAELAHLISLLDVAYVADLLSTMNFSILTKELEALQVSIEGKGKIQSGTYLPDGFFGISKDLFPENRGSFSLTPSVLPDEAVLRSLSDLERLRRNQKDIYKGHEEVRESAPLTSKEMQRPMAKPRQDAVQAPAIDEVKMERRQRVLDVLRLKGSGMIRDFSAVITDCSEKTIQRLLIEMVHGGVLKREGDRRWSRYFIVEGKGGNRSSS